ncbi:hypothetical protein JCGZ_08749 [Jatropha curcas]|uniref:Uncharacterized protein n=2 Tax=Jatropha curcas TaxID=180498 RepID=A0A067KV05_JATCU|nr:hypothetical protein JCGZ_08749 [Jatropha curcas]
MTTILSLKSSDDDDCLATSDMGAIFYQASESAKSLLLLLEKPSGSVTLDDLLCSKGISLSMNNVMYSSKTNQVSDTNAGKVDDYLYLGDLEEKFLWECPEALPDRLSQSIPSKRKLSSLDGASKRVKGENSVAEITGQNAFSRGLGQSATSSGPTRRDTFRQRKPNTSRPPSMHVDDYVARERNIDGGTNSNVIAVQRVGSTGGRPPSIHVDEFMARQRERQNPTAALVGEPSAHLKNTASVIDADKEKMNKSKPLKTDLDDDLQGIDIVFDGEESESDDKLLFPQPDDNLQLPAPVIVEQSSPHSIVEETESDANESGQFPRLGTPLASNIDENTQSEFSSRMSVSRPERPLTREPSVSSDKNFYDHSEDMKNVIPVKTSNGFDSVAAVSTSGFPAAVYNKAPVDSRITPQNFYAKNSPQHSSGSRGHYDQKVPPPLPPMPPPLTISPLISQNPDPVPSQSSPFVNSLVDVQQPLSTAFQVHPDFLSAYGNNPTSLASSLPISDSKYPRASISSPSGSAGTHPPLPPTPHPYSSSQYNLPSLKAPTSQSSAFGITELSQISNAPMIDGRLGNLSATGGGYIHPPVMQPTVFNRPAAIPATPYGSTPTQQQVENPTIMQNLSIQSSIQSIHQLQPLQPPLQRPTPPPQHVWPPVQSSQLLEHGLPIQNPVQMHQLQLLQQQQVSPMHAHYQSQQQEVSQSRRQQQQQVEHVQSQVQHQHGDVATRQQQELGMSLQEYFQDPKAITALLSNKEELCRLLEQNPKLMQMLQERLGQQ